MISCVFKLAITHCSTSFLLVFLLEVKEFNVEKMFNVASRVDKSFSTNCKTIRVGSYGQQTAELWLHFIGNI